MANLILFGGGDGGGIYIGADGKVHRIPPYDPALVAQLAVVSQLVKVSASIADAKLRAEVAGIAERIVSSVVPQTVKATGLQAAAGLSFTYVADDDGFVCGTAVPGVPFPIPRGIGQQTAAGA